MTIAELRERSNRAISGVPRDLLLAAVVLFASTASFGLGVLADRQMGQGGKDIWIDNAGATTSRGPIPEAAAAAGLAPIPTAQAGAAVVPATGTYVASKNGTKYYLPSCSAASRIKESNRIWFATKAEAEASGRTPASNCPGL